MYPSNDDAEIVALVRERSRKFVHTVFAGFAVIFAALALAAHNAPWLFSMPAHDMPRIAASLLFLSAAYVATMFVWDWMFGRAG